MGVWYTSVMTNYDEAYDYLDQAEAAVEKWDDKIDNLTIQLATYKKAKEKAIKKKERQEETVAKIQKLIDEVESEGSEEMETLRAQIMEKFDQGIPQSEFQEDFDRLKRWDEKRNSLAANVRALYYRRNS